MTSRINANCKYILCYFYEKQKCNIYIYGSYFYLWIRTKMYIGSEFNPLENNV